MTPIQAEKKTKIINYGEKPVESFWREIPVSSDLPDTDYPGEVQKILAPSVKDGVICVFSEELSSRYLCELLAKARDSGNRVYILVNDFNDEMKNLEGCLVRYGGSRRIGSFILINPNSGNSSGCMFTGRFSDGGLQLAENLLLTLDNDQISVLFRYFCHQFWNRSAKERIERESRDIDSAPVDIYPPSGDSCDFQYLQSVWSKEMNGAVITTSCLSENSFLKFSNISNSNIVSLYSGIDDNIVRSLKQKNNTIIAIDNICFINSIKTGESILLIPKIDTIPENEVYALSLNDIQSKVLDKHIINLSKSHVQYQYFEKEKREMLIGKTIIRLGEKLSEKYTIKQNGHAKLNIPQPSELFPKNQFDRFEPAFPDDERSVSITFEWENKPFVLPVGASRHQLYVDWEDTQKKITKYIDQILSNISENEKKEKSISGMLKHFFLGKKQKFNEYRVELESLQKTNYGPLGKDDLRGKIENINAVRKNVIKDAGEIAEEDRKARLQEEINIKKEKKSKLEKELSAKEKETADSETVRQELFEEFYKKGYIKKGGSLFDYLKSLEKQIETARKEKKEVPDDIQEKLSETRKVIKDTEDIKVKITKLENDLNSINKKIKEVNNETIRLEGQLKSNGEKAKEPKKDSILETMKGSGNKTAASTTSSSELPVPQLRRLPSSGELYQHNGQDYLAINYWEEYDKGKEEASRLNAKLCAKGGI
jgi:hypothetical protein